MAARLDLGLTTVQSIERGTPRKKVTLPIRSYARLVGWTDDSPERVLAGDEPLRVADRDARAAEAVASHEAETVASRPASAPSDLSARLRRAIADGQLIDSQVVTIPTEAGEITAAIVVRGQPDMSEEELGRALLEWEQRWQGQETRLREPAPESDE